MQKQGVKNISELVMFLGAAKQFYQTAKADGRIDGKDFFLSLPAIASLEPALQDIELASREWADLDEKEKAYLSVLFDQYLGQGSFTDDGADLMIIFEAISRIIKRHKK